MKRAIVTFIILCVFSCFLAAEETTLTLQEAIAIALRDNRTVLLKTEELNEAKAKIKEGQSSLWPTLNLVATQSSTRNLYEKDLTQTTAQTTLKQYLYKGGKTTNTIAQSRYKLTAAQAALETTKLEIALAVKKAFYTLLLAHEFVKVNKGIVENTEKHLQTLQARYQNGQASEKDILSVRDALEGVMAAYQESLNQVQTTQSLLKNLLYLDESVSIVADAAFVYEPYDVAIEEAFVAALQKRPEIKDYEAQVNATKKAVEISKADTRPSIYASWDYYNRSHAAVGTTTAVGTRGWNDYSVIGVTFSWPIFDGWATKAKIDQAIADLKQTQLNRDQLNKDIALELENAYAAIKNAIAELKKSEANLLYYERNLQEIKEKTTKGITSTLDLEDALLGQTISLFNKNQSVFNYIIAQSEFDKATGVY